MTLARQADRHACYEAAVQNPTFDAGFMARTFRRMRGRPARVLREDFCGTAALCAAWVKEHPENVAYGIDLDAPTLHWGIEHNLIPLGEAASRITLLQRDVRAPVAFKADIIAAFNFSFFCFHDPASLRGYLARARAGLVKDGVLYLDLFGGPEAQFIQNERRRQRGFTYIWEHAAFNPITHAMTCHIHFEFPDGSALRRAFTYHWRLWSIPELEEAARQAGFSDVVCYWEGTDYARGTGNGVYRPSRKGDNARSFIAYLACLR